MKIQAFVVAIVADWKPEGFFWAISGYDCKDSKACLVSFEIEVNFEPPADFNPIAAEVAALESAKVAALDAYHAEVAKLNERLSKLLAITA